MYKVLVVDDDYIICKGLQKFIKWQEYGFEADDYAMDGLEALEMMERNTYDLIIADIRMPNMDGIELIKSIRQKGYTLQIVILSGYRDFEYAQTALEYGVKKYILKPVNEKAFINTITEIRNEIEEGIRQKLTINESRLILKEKIVLDLLKSGENSIQAYKKAKDIGIEFDNKAFRVFIIDANCDDKKKQSNISSFIVKKTVEEIIRKYTEVYIAYVENNKIAVLICMDKNKMVPIKPILEEIIQFVEKYAGNTAFISVGNEVLKYELIFESFNNANIGFENGFISEESRIIYFDDIADKSAINSLVKYVRENCCEKLSLQFIANMFFFNPAYLGRVFKNYTGLSFNDFLIECKIEKAVKLLESKKYKVYEISEKVGYADYDHFCRVFKSKKGCTPSEYKACNK